jgi:GTP pyrophosphokinase
MAYTAYEAMPLDQMLNRVRKYHPGDGYLLVEKAWRFAEKAHEGQVRKSGEPYFTHPCLVASILTELMIDPPTIAAGLLHDTVEDAGVTVEEIRAACGERVAALVRSETEDKYRERPAGETWMQRKTEALEELKKAGDPGVRIMFLADKLANMRSFFRLFRKDGPAIWNGFNEKDPQKQEWYYRAVSELTKDLSGTDAWQEYTRLVDAVFGGEKDV